MKNKLLEKQICSIYSKALNYSLTHKNGNRSSARTDILNQDTAKMLKSFLDQGYKTAFEKTIDCSRGNTFTVDIILEHETLPDICVLLKSIESSYNKNRHNYLNATIGETTRILHLARQKKCAVVFINYIPEIVPVRKKDGTIKGYEKTKFCNIDKTISIISNNKALVIDAKISEDHRTVINIKDVVNKLNNIKRLI